MKPNSSQTRNQERSAMLRDEKVSVVLTKLSVPATLSMAVNALYNIVDTIFVGRGVGTNGIGGLTIAFPIQMAVMAVSLMLGVGSASAASRYLGAKDEERACHCVGTAFSAGLLCGLLMGILGQIFLEPILVFFGATETLLGSAREYMQIILLGTLYYPMVLVGNNVCRSEGNARTAMFSMIGGAVLNILLDFLFVFPLGMGIRGAALATILSQGFSLLYLAQYFIRRKSIYHLRPRHFVIQVKTLWEIVGVGFASFIRQIANSLVALVLNNMLKDFGGDTAISVYGIINRILTFLYMPTQGLVQGMQPIVGYNYGARAYDRVKKALHLSIVAGLAFAGVFTALIELFPGWIFRLFNDDAVLISAGAHALRLVCVLSLFAAVQIVGAGFFQAIGRVIPSFILTASRQILFFIPLALILPQIGGLGMWGIWLAFPLADGLSAVVKVIYLRHSLTVLSSGHDGNTR